ncbi:hypothetical protein [Alicyclobacillus sp. ALC3]|uniref:hypothetical protein n=1 Tax=Alicyclobacillus sp. ALC3 TaxID=2796143 RepID=UPI00237864F6|nr:hypothetical protein [Alicyclobacillus sp. ALC3]WDL97873.1 hypothetical protein JC200_03865 [Alicyclobacillus sp. ALC3]
MAAMRSTRTMEQTREEAVAAAERNPSYRFHDFIVIISLFAAYSIFFYGRSPGDQGET